MTDKTLLRTIFKNLRPFCIWTTHYIVKADWAYCIVVKACKSGFTQALIRKGLGHG